MLDEVKYRVRRGSCIAVKWMHHQWCLTSPLGHVRKPVTSACEESE